jgi:hypothetical protein
MSFKWGRPAPFGGGPALFLFVTYTKGQRRYRRRLGMAEPDEAPGGYLAGFTDCLHLLGFAVEIWVRTGLSAGGNRIRTIGPAAGARPPRGFGSMFVPTFP